MSEITDKLLTYPAAIKVAEEAVWDLIEVYELAHADVKEQDAGFAVIVNANPALKNQGQRDTEIKAMREASAEYTDALIEEETAAKNLAIARINLNFVQNMFQAYLAIVGGQKEC
ncbi:MAG: hypothetical protein PHH85_09095 [Candidatus Methanoperedens sp.]|nr:hypothetical protein [Candidatus Methanoperedens sp.]